MNWRQWFALLFFFVLYLLLGGVVFMFLESPEEEIRSKELGNLRNVIYGLYFLFFWQSRYISLKIIDIRRHFLFDPQINWSCVKQMWQMKSIS
jgi:hypothetical protein